MTTDSIIDIIIITIKGINAFMISMIAYTIITSTIIIISTIIASSINNLIITRIMIFSYANNHNYSN